MHIIKTYTLIDNIRYRIPSVVMSETELKNYEQQAKEFYNKMFDDSMRIEPTE